eukprot:1673376-Amphidinium_carterae.1
MLTIYKEAGPATAREVLGKVYCTPPALMSCASSAKSASLAQKMIIQTQGSTQHGCNMFLLPECLYADT